MVGFATKTVTVMIRIRLQDEEGSQEKNETRAKAVLLSRLQSGIRAARARNRSHHDVSQLQASCLSFGICGANAEASARLDGVRRRRWLPVPKVSHRTRQPRI